MTRFLFIALTLGVLVMVNGLFMYNEEIVLPDTQTKAEARASDPLFGRQFTASQREQNIREYGFDEAETGDILKRISTLEERYRVKTPEFNQVQVRIEEASDPDALVSAFCGTGSTLPVRYAALPFLVDLRGLQLKPVDVDDISSFEYNDWAKKARIQAVYEDADLLKQEERKADSVRMALAAVLAGDEATLLEHKAPWGRGVFSGWDWNDVKKKHPGIRTNLVDYVALMHLVLEVASREGGLCAT